MIHLVCREIRDYNFLQTVTKCQEWPGLFSWRKNWTSWHSLQNAVNNESVCRHRN
jgi:hypothetical protein